MQDREKAISWLTKASDAGYAEAQVNLATLLQGDDNIQACRLFASAVAAGRKDARNSLVKCYVAGITEGSLSNVKAAARVLSLDETYPVKMLAPKLHVIYRLSDYGHGTNKKRPSYVGLYSQPNPKPELNPRHSTKLIAYPQNSYRTESMLGEFQDQFQA